MLWLTAPLTCGCTMWCLNSTHNRRKSRFLFSLFFFHPAGSHMVLLLFTAWLEKNDLFYLDYQSCYSAIWQTHYIIACWSISPAAQVFDFSALTYGKIRVLWLILLICTYTHSSAYFRALYLLVGACAPLWLIHLIAYNLLNNREAEQVTVNCKVSYSKPDVAPGKAALLSPARRG